MKTKRVDRYSTAQTAVETYKYMAERIDDMIRLFRVPGFNHARFKSEFGALAKLRGKKLSSELHQLCLRYDKSEQVQFSKYKTRLRRYLFTRNGNKALIVSSSVRAELECMVQEDCYGSVNEAVEQLLFLRKLIKDQSEARPAEASSDYRLNPTTEDMAMLFGYNEQP